MEYLNRGLRGFIAESNAIEGIVREPTGEEVVATRHFLLLNKLTIPDLETLVDVYQPGARLREYSSMNVRVGNYVAPGGGLSLVGRLGALLSVANHLDANRDAVTPWHAHVEYEMLHPFQDGNGRSGRALWAWVMIKRGEDPYRLGFLHSFYYQTLGERR